MKLQITDEINERIRLSFETLKREHPERLHRRLDLSFSTWVFGMEDLEESMERLSRFGLKYIEIGGNYGGPDVGYQSDAEGVKKLLAKYDMKCSGICGFFGDSNALSTNNSFNRQIAKDYIRNEVKFCKEIGGTYMLVVPGTVGRAAPYDSSDYERSVETLRSVADVFIENDILCAVEPINSAEVPICSTVESVKQYIKDVNHPGVKHINGDIFHMLCGERHISEAIMDCGDALVNLHVEDTNRMPLGNGMMDVDTIIRALYLMGYNKEGKFVTGEPLGAGRDSYALMYGRHSAEFKDGLVSDTVKCFREREEELLK